MKQTMFETFNVPAMFVVEAVLSTFAVRHTTGIVLGLPRAHVLTMLELFYIPGMYKATFASGLTKGIVMDSGVLMFVRSTCPPRSRRSWLFCLCLLRDTRRAS